MTSRSGLRIAGVAVAGIVGAVLWFSAVPSAAVASATSMWPYCIDVGGVWGKGSTPLKCGFVDYQRCLEVSAVEHGDCVPNPDYRGEYPPRQTSVPPGSPRRRH